MMTNLFSIFDPSSSVLSLSWAVLLLAPVFVETGLFNISPVCSKMMSKLIKTMKKEVSFTLNKKEKSSESMIMLLFTAVLLMNFLALYPQIFSPTSHLAVTLPVSLSFWVSLMLFGWLQNTNSMLSHLVPQGTPNALMMFMVMIELVSNVIRPITLCVRLTANLIAGHLLMTLLGSALSALSWHNMIPMMFMPVSLTVLESAVACIQAYVFMTLVTLYTTEVK